MNKIWIEQSWREKSRINVGNFCYSNWVKVKLLFCNAISCLMGVSCPLHRWVTVVCFAFHEQKKIFLPVQRGFFFFVYTDL